MIFAYKEKFINKYKKGNASKSAEYKESNFLKTVVFATRTDP